MFNAADLQYSARYFRISERYLLILSMIMRKTKDEPHKRFFFRKISDFMVENSIDESTLTPMADIDPGFPGPGDPVPVFWPISPVPVGPLCTTINSSDKIMI